MRKYFMMFLPLGIAFMLTACANDETERQSETRLDDEILSDVLQTEDDRSGESPELDKSSEPGKDSGSKENAGAGEETGSEGENADAGGGTGSEEENSGMGEGYRYIDSVSLPDYARKFYEVLEESTDNDGEKDFLIEDQYFMAGDVTSEHLADLLTPDQEPYQIIHDKDRACMYVMKDSDEEADAVLEHLHTAYDIFQTDHPEVFWLTGNEPDFSYSTIHNGRRTERYYFLDLKSFHDSSYDIRKGYSEKQIREDIFSMEQSVQSILSGMPDGNVYEKVKYFNEWLSKHNSYKHDSSAGEEKAQSENNRESISALLGSVGEDGPDCRGYAFAFKVLCDRARIPCITAIVENPYYAWNYVQGGQLWYGVDVTWNDPPMFDQDGNRVAETAVSGYEREGFLMCGTDTVSEQNGEQQTFEESYHPQDKLKYPLAQHIKISEVEYTN